MGDGLDLGLQVRLVLLEHEDLAAAGQEPGDDVARQGEEDAQLEDADVGSGLVAEHVEQLPMGEPGRDDAEVALLRRSG